VSNDRIDVDGSYRRKSKQYIKLGLETKKKNPHSYKVRSFPLSIIKTTRSKKIQQVDDSPPERRDCLYMDAAILYGKKRFRIW
jgi:hypothetical protein